MGRRMRLSTVCVERNPGAGLSNTGAAVPTDFSSHAVPSDSLLRSQYQRLTRKQLSHLSRKLIAEYTGLNLHIAWAPPGSSDWDTARLRSPASACCGVARRNPAARITCQRCGQTQFARALNADRKGLFFECPLGVLSYWLPIRVRDLTVGVAYLQALDVRNHRQPSRPRPTRAAPSVVSRPEFHRGTRLLQLMVDYLQTLDLAELRKIELTNAGQAVLALEREQVRLHDALKRHLPTPPLVSRGSGSATKGEEAVHQLIEWISRDYAQPLTLRACAANLGMNVTYLSDLFSRTVGVSFKACLTEFRLNTAKAMLGDFRHTVSEVAYAVGYASENRFRATFKKATGLAPGTWRARLRAQSDQR